MEIRTECSAGHLTAGVGHGLHQAFKVEIDSQLGVDPVQCLQRARFFAQRRFAGFKGCAGQVRVGDVVAFTEDPGDLACGVKQGLIDEIQITDFGRGIGMVQLDRRALVHQALAGVVHRIEPLIKALAAQLRECLINGLADVIAFTEQPSVGLIHEFKAVLGAVENSDETRCLLEHFALAYQFFGLAPLGQHPLGDLMALIENAGDQAVLPTDGREAVVPPGFLQLTAALHHQQLIKGREAFAITDGGLHLRPHDVPNAGPDFARRPAQHGWVPIRRNRRPGIVV
jgi:hypothetical protein